MKSKRIFLFIMSIYCGLMVPIQLRADSSTKNITTAEKMYSEIFGKGNLSLIDEIVAEKFVEHEEMPEAKSGREGLRDMVTNFRTAFPDIQVKVHQIIGKGNSVWAYISFVGTHKGTFMDIAATGKPMEMKTVDILKFDDKGKLTEHWGVSDMLSVLHQLGAMGTKEPTGTENPPGKK